MRLFKLVVCFFILHISFSQTFEAQISDNKIGLNDISELPSSFGGLSDLEGLDLEFNSIDKLPESFGNLYNLKYLMGCYKMYCIIYILILKQFLWNILLFIPELFRELEYVIE